MDSIKNQKLLRKSALCDETFRIILTCHVVDRDVVLSPGIFGLVQIVAASRLGKTPSFFIIINFPAIQPYLQHRFKARYSSLLLLVLYQELIAIHFRILAFRDVKCKYYLQIWGTWCGGGAYYSLKFGMNVA